MGTLNITSLLQPSAFDHPVEYCQLIETHISWVILTGTFAYKIKKPVNMGFLDFSTLEKRHFYCQEEVRLNKRLAPQIYLEVVTISGDSGHAFINRDNAGNVLDYAVKMREFSQSAQLDHILERGELTPIMTDAFARRVAAFHQEILIAGTESAFGDPEQVHQPVKENFSQIRNQIREHVHPQEPLVELENWCNKEYSRLESTFRQRKRDGFIRECHGDMHLRNLAWIDGQPVAFDCIEFNPDLRWIDVLSEVAFLVMDLQDRAQAPLAQRFLNRYLEFSGDYAGLAVLPYYLFYRAMVRAKVDAIRLGQAGIGVEEKQKAENDFNSYLELARMYTQEHAPKLIMTRGLSASGKTTLSQILLEHLGAIRIRSDVERKRLYGINPLQPAGSAPGEGIYTAEAGQRTYARLLELAGQILTAGFTVIVDATFLKAEQRQPFAQLAREKNLPCAILEFTATPATLRQRISSRETEVSDADLTVLEHQLDQYQPLTREEKSFLIEIDTEQPFEVEGLIAAINNRTN